MEKGNEGERKRGRKEGREEGRKKGGWGKNGSYHYH